MSTIIVPTTAGRSRLLKRTLDSIKDSGHEIIVVVDGDSASSELMLSRLDCKVVKIEKEAGKYRNPSVAISAGMKEADEGTVVILHDDCFAADQNSIEALVEASSKGIIARGKVQAYDGVINQVAYENFRQDEKTIGGHFFSIQKSDFEKIGGFHERIGFMITCELDLLILSASTHGISTKYVDEALCYHLRHSVSGNREFARRHNKMAIKQIRRELSEAPVDKTENEEDEESPEPDEIESPVSGREDGQ